jgi:hypothetical protein
LVSVVGVGVGLGLLLLWMLFFADFPRDVAELPLPDKRKHKPAKEEVREAVALIEELSADWDPSKYKDRHRDRLKRIVKKKEKGRVAGGREEGREGDGLVAVDGIALERLAAQVRERRVRAVLGPVHRVGAAVRVALLRRPRGGRAALRRGRRVALTRLRRSLERVDDRRDAVAHALAHAVELRKARLRVAVDRRDLGQRTLGRARGRRGDQRGRREHGQQ